VAGLAEVRLIEFEAATLERRDPVANGARVSALARGGLVLLSSHLEAYVKGLVEETLEQIHRKQVPLQKLPKRAFYFATQDLLREIGQTSDPEKIGEKLLALQMRDGDNLRAVGPLANPFDWDVFEQGFSTPKIKYIAKFLKRVGYASLRADLSQRQTVEFQVITNSVDHLVDTRNAIAHGDQAIKKTPSELRDLRHKVQRFCRDLDDSYCSWCSAELCAIRS
jgi:hypothetical protein